MFENLVASQNKIKLKGYFYFKEVNTVKNKALVGCQKLLYVGKGYMGLRKTAI